MKKNFIALFIGFVIILAILIGVHKSSDVKKASMASSSSSQAVKVTKNKQNKNSKHNYINISEENSENAKKQKKIRESQKSSSNDVEVGEDLSIYVTNADTNGKKVHVTLSQIVKARKEITKAGFPGKQYSNGNIAQMIIKAKANSTTVVNVAKGKVTK